MMDRTTKLMAVGAVAIWAVFGALVAPKFTKVWSATARAKERVARDLKDPSSAQFRNLKAGERAVCGEVNAKNSYGAYVGFRHFIVQEDVASLEPDLPTERLHPGVSLRALEQWNAYTPFQGEWLSKCDAPLPPLPTALEPDFPTLKR